MTDVTAALAAIRRAATLRQTLDATFRDEAVRSIYSEAARIAARAVHRPGGRRVDVDQRIDRLVTSPVFGLPITFYGDGLQVRDLLWVEDLVDLYLAAAEKRTAVAGRAYNVGGGPAFRLSLKELMGMLEKRLKRAIQSEIENPLAKAILEGRFAPKDTIRVDWRGGRVSFEKAPARAAA